MPALLTHRLNRIILPAAMIFMMAFTAKAQCSLTKATVGNVTTISTPEDYQYVRANKSYDAVAIKTILSKKPGRSLFYADITYTGSAKHTAFTGVIFKLDNDEQQAFKLRLTKTRKNDDKKLSTKTFEIALSETVLEMLTQKQLKEVIIRTPADKIIIPIKNPALLHDEIVCLQKEL